MAIVGDRLIAIPVDRLVDVACEFRAAEITLTISRIRPCKRSDDGLRSVLRWTPVNCARLATFTPSACDRRFGEI